MVSCSELDKPTSRYVLGYEIVKQARLPMIMWHRSVKPLIDGGTEGFQGQVRPVQSPPPMGSPTAAYSLLTPLWYFRQE